MKEEVYYLIIFSYHIVIVSKNPCLIKNQRPPTIDYKWGFLITCQSLSLLFLFVFNYRMKLYHETKIFVIHLFFIAEIFQWIVKRIKKRKLFKHLKFFYFYSPFHQ